MWTGCCGIRKKMRFFSRSSNAIRAEANLLEELRKGLEQKQVRRLREGLGGPYLPAVEGGAAAAEIAASTESEDLEDRE